MSSRLVFLPATAAPETDGIHGQTRSVLARVDQQLRTAGSSLADAVVITVYLRDAADFAAMNDAYREAFTSDPPTRTTVVTDLLTPGSLVAMSAVGVTAGAERFVIHPAAWLPSPRPYSYAIRSDDVVFLSGLLARNGRDNSPAGGDVAAQTRAILTNAGELLAAAHLTHRHIVSARVFLTDIAQFDAMNSVYGEFFPEAPPARATVGTRLTASPYNVEIAFTASTADRSVVDDGGTTYRNLSTAIRTGSCLYVSGLLGVTDATRHDASAQTRAIFQRLDSILASGGFRREDVRDLLVYVTDEPTGMLVRHETAALFDGRAPAVTVVKAALAIPDGKVEIMATAVRP